MRRADRLFQLVQLLRLRRHATGQDLADELGVSLRTVYRDIRDLEYSGVPIRGEAGVGYRLDRGYELPPLTFSEAELEGLVLGARMVATWADPELAEAVRSAMTKIEAVLPEGLRRVVLETALYAPDFPRTQEMSRDVDLMRRAISEHRWLAFDYERLFSDLAESKVECTRRLYGDGFLVDESVWEGTAPGTPFGLPGKGRPLRFRLLHVVEFTDGGQIQKEQVWIDLASVIQQLPGD